MKKKLVIVGVIILVILLILGIMYAVDRNRMKNNKPVIFSTWGYSYAPPMNEIECTEDRASDKNSFVGTVLEETTTYMIVEPNEDEEERKSADRIVISYGVDHIDYLYGIGRKVVITYSGGIMETYPAQIKTNDISVDGYEDFEITVKKSNEVEKKKILNNMELYKNNSDFDLYYYGLEEVNVTVDNKTMSLEEALRSGKITLDKIISNANEDLDNKTITGDIYKDGGTMIYQYGDYTIVKYHTLDGNRDVYISMPITTINEID